MAGKPSHLYVIGAEGVDFIKVGRSKNPESRLVQLRTSAPYKLRLLQVYEDEGHLEPHILKLLRDRVPMNGEWFLASDIDFPTLLATAREAQALMAQNTYKYRDISQTGLGAQVKLARKAKGWQQKDLRDATGLSQKYLSEIERDKVDPRFSIVQRIAKALKVSLNQLGQEDVSHADT